MIKRFLIVIAFLIFLNACASTGIDSDGQTSAGRQAAEVNTSLGREYMNRGQLEIALEKLKRAVNADPGYAPAHTVLAVLYEQIREPELAEKHYKRAIDILPENGDTNNNYGVFLCHSGRASSAVPYFLKAIDDPFYRTPAVAFANAGSCELQQGNLDKAESYLRQSLEYDAEFADALLYINGEMFGARAFLQRYESAGPENIDSLSLGFRIESELNNSEGAKEYADRLLIRFPESELAKEIRG
jgi:type IV pilus assembly protein PilF